MRDGLDSPPVEDHAQRTLTQEALPAFKMRWAAWLLSAIILPVWPWLSDVGLESDFASLLGSTATALLAVVATSCWLARGFAKCRCLGFGMTFGVYVMFIMAGVGMGAVVWLLGLAGHIWAAYKAAGY